MTSWLNNKIASLFVTNQDPSTLLCLNCRRSGHLKRDCPETDWYLDGLDPVSDLHHTKLTSARSSDLCRRCRSLNILSMFKGELKWKRHSDLSVRKLRGNPHYRSLGAASEAVFLITCPLCVTLFAVASNPDNEDDDLHIVADWTVHHLDHWVTVGPETTGPCNICISVVAAPKNGTVDYMERERDALGVCSEEMSTRALGLRSVNKDVAHVAWMKECLAVCKRLHPSLCAREVSSDLTGIKLVDVEARRVVQCSDSSCDYLTLSYVWGGYTPVYYNVGEDLEFLPRTIEDAITLTKLLGYRYLWIDYLCVIPQNDLVEKVRQINKMSSIYEGADACIVAMSTETMDGGLARIPGSSRKNKAQISCVIDGKQLLSTMPALRRQIRLGKWATRSWTLQEALLSPRCFYISDYQVYFECNAMQYCESLDESTSQIHQFVREHELTDSDSDQLIRIYGRGEFRKPSAGLGRSLPRLDLYDSLLHQYSRRQMTSDDDALNAFTGIMSYLTRVSFSAGFCWGHPREVFNWSLLWYTKFPEERRPDRFPRWSWSGWKGITTCFHNQEEGCKVQAHSTHFHVCEVLDGEFRTLFPVEGDTADHGRRPFSVETKFDNIKDLICEQNHPTTDFGKAENRGFIFIDCAVCQFEVTVVYAVADEVANHIDYIVDLRGNECIMRVAPVTVAHSPGQKIAFDNAALVARGSRASTVFHYFLEVRFDKDGSASRTGVCCSLGIPQNTPSAVDMIEVTRKKFMMI